MPAKPPEAWGEEYRLIRPKIEAFTAALQRLLAELLEVQEVPVSQIEGRTKDPRSFVEKIYRKNEKYDDPLVQMTDQSGIRIIAYYPVDLESIGSLIEDEFTVDWENSVRRGTDTDPDRFGYRSDHYVVRLSAARAKLAEWASYQNLSSELQVRTVMQHAWAAVDHKIRYKRQDLPVPLQRRLSRLSAILELADEQFATIQRESAEVSAEYEKALSGGDFDVGLNVLSLRGFLGTSRFLGDWTTRALAKEYRTSEKSDHMETDAAGYVESEDWSLLMKILRDLRVTSIDAVQRHLTDAEQWGDWVLERIKVHSEESEDKFTPVAVPKDVLAFLFLYKGANLALVDRTGYIQPLRRGIKATIRERENAPND
jgi:putative GTP pyrophosphokinase